VISGDAANFSVVLVTFAAVSVAVKEMALEHPQL
jgi:hypothetical protein